MTVHMLVSIYTLSDTLTSTRSRHRGAFIRSPNA